MIPLIENQITLTKDLFYEGIKATENASFKKILRVLCIVIAVLFVGISVWTLLTGGSIVFLIGEFFFLGALLVWLAFIYPGSRRRNVYKAMCRGCSDAPKRTIQFFPNHFTVITSTGNRRDFDYKEIEAVKETARLYLLVESSGTGILLAKDGFTRGSWEELKAYLPK